MVGVGLIFKSEFIEAQLIVYTRISQFFRVLVPLLALTACGGTPQVQPEPQPGVQPASQGAIPASGETPAGYLLGEGDRISIQVFDEPDLTMESLLGASGIINYSYLGDLQVAGKTSQQVERQITQLLQDGYLVNPSVNVTVVNYRPFFINGEVRSPGSYPYQPGLTLDKAIALAGGLTDRASTRKMFILKSANNNQDEQKASMQTRIAPGDIISIKEGFF